MTTNFDSPVTDDEVVAACKAGCFFVTRESVKDVRKVLENFVAGRKAPERIPALYQFRERKTKFYGWSNWHTCIQEVFDNIELDIKLDGLTNTQVRKLYAD